MIEAEVDQLRRLASLHADGILTDEEFAAKKAQLLGLADAPPVEPVRGRRSKTRAERAWSEAKAAVGCEVAAIIVWVPALLLGAEPTDPISTVPSLLSLIAGVSGILAVVRGIRGRRDVDGSLALRALKWGGAVVALQIVATVVVLVLAATGSFGSSGGEYASPEAEATARRMTYALKAADSMESCGAESVDGSFANCGEDNLDAYLTDAGITVNVSSDSYDYDVTMDRRDGAPSFTVQHRGAGSLIKSCEPADELLCPDGEWPSLDDLKAQ